MSVSFPNVPIPFLFIPCTFMAILVGFQEGEKVKCSVNVIWPSQVTLVVKNLPANAANLRDTGSIPGWGRSPGKGKATHASILDWKIPWAEEPGGLQSTGWQSQTRLK